MSGNSTEDLCFCNKMGLGDPEVSCGDCPKRDYPHLKGKTPPEDLKLLQAAAKAANVVDGRFYGPRGLYMNNDLYWNPLDDDGDAFRLAVDLGIKVYHYPVNSNEPFGVGACKKIIDETTGESDYKGLDAIRNYGKDKREATRRVIVEVAAEMGSV